MGYLICIFLTLFVSSFRCLKVIFKSIQDLRFVIIFKWWTFLLVYWLTSIVEHWDSDSKGHWAILITVDCIGMCVLDGYKLLSLLFRYSKRINGYFPFYPANRTHRVLDFVGPFLAAPIAFWYFYQGTTLDYYYIIARVVVEFGRPLVQCFFGPVVLGHRSNRVSTKTIIHQKSYSIQTIRHPICYINPCRPVLNGRRRL